MLRILSAHGLFSLARAFIGAVLIIYLMGRGIDLSVIAIAKSAQLVASVLFNYPAGLIADKYGNKPVILLACCAELLYFCLMLSPSNNNVIIGETCNRLGIALYIGAYEAWLFTQKTGKEDSFSLISRSSEMLFIATILSGVIGAIFSQYSLLLSMAFMAVSFFAYAFTPEIKKPINKTPQDSPSGLLTLVKTANYNVANYSESCGFYLCCIYGYAVVFTYYARKRSFNNYPYASIFCYLGIIITSLIIIAAPAYLFHFIYRQCGKLFFCKKL